MISAVNIHSSVVVYVQIENEVQFAIASGKLKPGDRLPALREMSQTLGVNPNTVAKAYRDLEVMGLVYIRRGIGVFIENGIQAECRKLCRKRIAQKLHEVTQEAKAASMSKTRLAAFIDKSFAIEASPYGEVPKEVLAVAKAKK